ncbi:uncharacterized protein LOC135958872 [Calliphora vicina]|uniref:uncharacterized protein LOC135958872 n=1 Tax=Calliphora vicina TaxID=7373 RepID=UPI00325B55F2
MENNTQKRRRYQKDLAPTDDILTLIHLVRQNPTLYNYKLQPNQRRRIDILNGWAEIAAAIGNKYTVEECRRKWKNLRDTYHQYRLRKPKMSDGLSKWRYAKDMEFLSNVYQPKLKSNRTQNYNTTPQDNLLHSVSESTDEHDHVVSQDMVHPNIISVNDTDTFILTTYEDVTHDNDVSHEDPNMVSHSELNHDQNSMEDCVEIVKHEQHVTLDDDGNTGGEVDYEEVCLYEESGNTPSVDCETIIGAGAGTNSANSDDTKFQYIDANDFCIASMNPTRSQYSSSASSVIGAAGTIKLKTLPMVSSSTTSTASSTLDSTASCVAISSPSVHLQTLPELTPSPAIPPSTTTASTPATYMYASINPTRSQYNNNNNTGSVIGPTGTIKLKNIPTVSSSTTAMPSTSSTTLDSTTSCGTIASSPSVHIQNLPELTASPTTPSTTPIDTKHDGNSLLTSANTNSQQMQPIYANTPSTSSVMSSSATMFCIHQREECDLFFDFLKKKIQRFPPEEITSIQVEFLNCVLRREAEHAQKAQQQQHQQQHNSIH